MQKHLPRCFHSYTVFKYTYKSTYPGASTPLLYTRTRTETLTHMLPHLLMSSRISHREALTQMLPQLHCIYLHIEKHLPRCFHMCTVPIYTYRSTYPDASTPLMYPHTHREALTQMLPHLYCTHVHILKYLPRCFHTCWWAVGYHILRGRQNWRR